MSADQRLPRRPYLLRAMHQWMSDAGMTPHVLVDTYFEGVDVPKAHARDGRIVLNIGLAATRHLDLGNELITFEARFAGVPRVVRVPVGAVLSVYARETGEGMVFPPEGELAPPAALLGPRQPEAAPAPSAGGSRPDAGDRGPPQGGPTRPRPNLKIVK